MKENYAFCNYLCGDSQGIEKLTQIILQGKDNHDREINKGINLLRELTTFKNKTEIDNCLQKILINTEMPEYLKEQIQTDLNTDAEVWVLILDESNDFVSQIIEFMGNEDSDLYFFSAGLYPEEEKYINIDAVNWIKQRCGVDIRENQYCKIFNNLWRFDYIIPIGIEIDKSNFPFQKIISGFEGVKLDFTIIENHIINITEEIIEKVTKDVEKSRV